MVDLLIMERREMKKERRLNIIVKPAVVTRVVWWGNVKK